MYKSKFDKHLEQFEKAKSFRLNQETLKSNKLKRINLEMDLRQSILQKKEKGFNLMHQQYLDYCNELYVFIAEYKKRENSKQEK